MRNMVLGLVAELQGVLLEHLGRGLLVGLAQRTCVSLSPTLDEPDCVLIICLGLAISKLDVGELGCGKLVARVDLLEPVDDLVFFLALLDELAWSTGSLANAGEPLEQDLETTNHLANGKALVSVR